MPTKPFNEKVKRNADRFLGEPMFQLTSDEKAEMIAKWDHLHKLKFFKALPFDAIQASNLLGSPQAVEMGIYVARAFVRLRKSAATNAYRVKRLDELEQKTEGIALSHDTPTPPDRAYADAQQHFHFSGREP